MKKNASIDRVERHWFIACLLTGLLFILSIEGFYTDIHKVNLPLYYQFKLSDSSVTVEAEESCFLKESKILQDCLEDVDANELQVDIDFSQHVTADEFRYVLNIMKDAHADHINQSLNNAAICIENEKKSLQSWRSFSLEQYAKLLNFIHFLHMPSVETLVVDDFAHYLKEKEESLLLKKELIDKLYEPLQKNVSSKLINLLCTKRFYRSSEPLKELAFSIDGKKIFTKVVSKTPVILACDLDTQATSTFSVSRPNLVKLFTRGTPSTNAQAFCGDVLYVDQGITTRISFPDEKAEFFGLEIEKIHKREKSLYLASSSIKRFAFCGKTEEIAAIKKDGGVFLWDDQGELLRSVYVYAANEKRRRNYRPSCLAFSYDGCCLAVGFSNGDISLYDTLGNGFCVTHQTGSGNACSILFSKNRNYVASVHKKDPENRIFLENMEKTEMYDFAAGESMQFNEDGSLMAIQLKKGIMVREIPSGNIRYKIFSDVFIESFIFNDAGNSITFLDPNGRDICQYDLVNRENIKKALYGKTKE